MPPRIYKVSCTDLHQERTILRFRLAHFVTLPTSKSNGGEVEPDFPLSSCGQLKRDCFLSYAKVGLGQSVPKTMTT